LRLDLFLKLSRVCPRRTIAQQLCDAGFVLLNDQPAKSAHPIKLNDIITIRRRDQQLKVRVLKVPETRNVSRRDSSQLIELIGEKRLEPFDD